MVCRKADRFRSAFATRCAWPPEINAARTYVVTKRSSALLTAALRRQRSHVRIVSGAPDFPYLPARYVRADLCSGYAWFQRVSNLGENRRRVQNAWQLTVSVERSLT